MSTGTYKQSVITVTKLVILQNFIEKSHSLKPALNNLLHVYRQSLAILHH